MFTVTKITAIKPAHLAKAYTLSEGVLQKEVSAQLQKGKIDVLSLTSLSDFADVLQSLTPAEALVYGVPTDCEAEFVVTKRALETTPTGAGMIARSKEHFRWPDGGGIMMLDYDPVPGEKPLSREDLAAVLADTVPETDSTQMIWWQSSSSHICKIDGDDLTELSGQRIYLPVADAGDISRAGAVLQERLWLKGYGRMLISTSGSMLDRTTFDAVVWQPTRLDFAGGAVTGPGLEQRRSSPLLMNETGTGFLDTKFALASLDVGSTAIVSDMKKIKRNEMHAEAAQTRQAWLSTRRHECLKSIAANAPAETVQTLQDALDHETLGSDFVLFVQVAGRRSFEPLTVEKIFEDPVKYDGCLTLDPIEPEYDGGRPVGKLFLGGKTPFLNSFARGGMRWAFSTFLTDITIEPGGMANATKELLAAMRKDSRFFDYGGVLVTVTESGILQLNEFSLEMMLVDSIQFYGRFKNDTLKPVNPPSRVLKQVLSLGTARRLKPLKGILNAPSVREDGTMLLAPGYDAQSELFLNFKIGDYPDISSSPTPAEAKAALDSLWMPVGEFPYVDGESRGAMLAALLTAAIRPALPTAPMIHLDAPVIGSGKTLAAEALGTLATGDRISVSAPPCAGDESEMRKLLTTSALPGNSGVLIFDNCVGQLGSGALCAFLSSSMWNDRILGSNKLSGALPTRLFVAVSGTNLTFSRDLNRRTIQCRIDPRLEAAFEREFDFCPVAMIRERRPELIASALTLILASQQADLPKTKGRLASFDVWDRIVRRTVIYAGTSLKPGFYADPVLGLRERTISDDDAADNRRLLEALKEEFGDVWFLAKDVADKVNAETGAENLRDIFSDIRRGNGPISSRSTGRYLRSNLDRICGGFVLRSKRKGASLDWKVEAIS